MESGGGELRWLARPPLPSKPFSSSLSSFLLRSHNRISETEGGEGGGSGGGGGGRESAENAFAVSCKGGFCVFPTPGFPGAQLVKVPRVAKKKKRKTVSCRSSSFFPPFPLCRKENTSGPLGVEAAKEGKKKWLPDA